MILHDPITITPRLLPGIKIGDAYLSIDYDDEPGELGRTRYRYFIDLPGGTEYSNNDLQSGCGGGNLLEGLTSLVGFLAACGESYASGLGEDGWGECADLFPTAVGEWCAENKDELESVGSELNETETPLIEE